MTCFHLCGVLLTVQLTLFSFLCSMDMMTEGDYAAAAVFLGEQVRLLHSLPLPSTLSRTTWAQKISRLNGQGSTNSIETSVTLGHGIMVNGSVVKHCFDSSVSTDKANTVVGSEMFLQTGISTGDMDKKKELHADIPMEWHYFVGLMRQQRAKILERFEIW